MTTGVVTMDAINPNISWMNGRPVFSWDDLNIERLKTLIANKFSAAEIAAQLGTGRNSVLGKIHRLGLSMPNRPGSAHTRPRPKPKADHWTGFPKRKSPDRKPPMIVDNHQSPKVECVPLNVPFLELEPGQCKFPYGDTAPFLFCGLPSEGDGPYCHVHSNICQANRGGWTRPDRTYAVRRLHTRRKMENLDFIDPPTPEQLPDVA